MILQVYAMWNQSKKVLYILLFVYVPQIIAPLVVVGIYNTYLPGMSQARLQLNWNLISGIMAPTTFLSSHSCASYY